MPDFSEALDEIAAGAYQPKTAALVPENDKVVMNGGRSDPAKILPVPGGSPDRPPSARAMQQVQQPGDVLPEPR